MKEEWDKRRRYERHFEGKHTQRCNTYSLSYCGMVCKYTGQSNFMQSDLMRFMFSK